MRLAISGSISSRPACLSCWNVACVVATAWMLLGERAGALPEDAGLRPGQIDHRRRHARQLADVDDRAAGRADLVRNVLHAPWVGSAGAVRAGSGHDAEL